MTQCPARLMAKLAGCSDQHLRNLVKRGEINQTGRGKYDAFKVMAYLLNQTPDAMTAMQEAKLQETLEKARKDRLANDQTERLLIASDDVEVFINEYTGIVLQYAERLRKGIGAIVDLPTRKKVNERARDIREQAHKQVEVFKSGACAAVETAAGSDAE